MEKRKLNKSRVSDAPEETPVLESHFEEASGDVKRWLDFCRSHALVKCVDVPTGILPKCYTGVLIDVKVGGKKRVPYDKIYLAHKELRQKVARGNCVLELNTLERGKICRTTYIFLVFALKKFSGGMGDDDDSQNSKFEWLHYFLKPLEKAHKIISTEKCNGEAAHISAVKLLGSTYFCIGSKNVHMLARNADDTEKYKDGRFQIASVVSKTFFQTFMDNPDITEKQKKSFVTFVQENSYTAVAEILQPTHQHVVTSNLSYLQHPELRFICWTKADVDEDFSSCSTLCPMAINEAIDKAREFGLQTCDYELVNIGGNLVEKIERYMQKIRKDHGHEGRVLYFLDEHNYRIGLIKKKTAWYIILRAVREKLASFSGYDKKLSVSERDAKIRKRIKEIQIWLEFSDSYADKWIEISCALARWTFSQTITDIIRCTFPLIFQTFLEQNSNFRGKYDALLSDHEELFG